MTSHSLGFTALDLNNRMDGARVRSCGEYPSLVSGEVQRNSQAAFRQHMLNNTNVDDLLKSFESILDPELKGRQAKDILIINAAVAMSAPCDDYDILFEYIYEKFDEFDISIIEDCLEVTKLLLNYNPINPYLAFKASSIDNWGGMNEAFAFGDKLLQMAVIFDDVKMVEKVSKSRFAGDFRKNLCEALAKTVFDPLSNVRCWADMTSPSMIEVECRISRQARALQAIPIASQPMGCDLSGNLLYKITPEIASLSQFYAGEYNLFSLTTKSEDHMLRHIPGYSCFIKNFPEMIENCLDAAITHQKYNLIPALIKDMKNSGIPIYKILYKHIDRHSNGEYLDKIANKNMLTQQYMENLLSFSGHLANEITKPFNLAGQTLLGLVDPMLIEKYAKSDAQLQSAYAATGEKKYLERMSEPAALEQLGKDLGL